MTRASQSFTLASDPRIGLINGIRNRGYMHRKQSLLPLLLTLLASPGPHTRRAQLIAYDCEPRESNGHVDTPALFRLLRHAGVDGYDFLIWHSATDWDDFRSYLSQADSANLVSWVTLTPPTEQRPPHGPTPPFGTDFVAWQRAIATLAARHPQLQALVIDDFDYNTQFFSLDLLRRMRVARDSLGGRPLLYAVVYQHTLDSLATWWAARGSMLDGIVFAFEDFTSTDSLATLLQRAREQLPAHVTLALNLYITGGYRAPSPRRKAEYVAHALAAADTLADVIRLYCLPTSPADSLVETIARFSKRETRTPGLRD